MRRLMMCSLLFGLSTAVAVAGPPRFKYTAEVPTAAQPKVEPAATAQPVAPTASVAAPAERLHPIDWGKVERKLNTLYPKCEVHLIPMGGAILVRGTTDTPKQQESIMSAARKSLDGKVLPNPVRFVNQLKVNPTQPNVVVLRSTLVEVPRNQWSNFVDAQVGSPTQHSPHASVQVLNEQVVSEWLQGVAKSKDVRVLSSPTCAVIPGHTATIQMHIPQPNSRLRSVLNLPARQPIPFQCSTTVTCPKKDVYLLKIDLSGESKVAATVVAKADQAIVIPHPDSTPETVRLLVMTPGSQTIQNSVKNATLSLNVVRPNPVSPGTRYPSPYSQPVQPTTRLAQPTPYVPAGAPVYKPVPPSVYPVSRPTPQPPAYQPPKTPVSRTPVMKPNVVNPPNSPWRPVAGANPTCSSKQCPAGTVCPPSVTSTQVKQCGPAVHGIALYGQQQCSTSCPLTGCTVGVGGPACCPLKPHGLTIGTPLAYRVVQVNTKGENPACCVDGKCCCKDNGKQCQCAGPVTRIYTVPQLPGKTVAQAFPAWVGKYPTPWPSIQPPVRTGSAAPWQPYTVAWNPGTPLPGHATRIQHLVRAAHHLDQAGRKKEAAELRRQISKTQQECLEQLLKVRKQEVKTLEAQLQRLKEQQAKPKVRPSASLNNVNDTFHLTFSGQPLEFQRLHRVPEVTPVGEFKCITPATTNAVATPYVRGACNGGACCGFSGVSAAGSCLRALFNTGLPGGPVKNFIQPVVNWQLHKEAHQEKSPKGQTLPSAYYLEDDIQYFPAGQSGKPINEAQKEKLGVEVEFDFEVKPPAAKFTPSY